jgi:iron complex transport system substrate-binding protein
MGLFPRKIVCLTEESVEILYRLKKQHLIGGISVYVERPPEAKNNHPKVTAFTGGSLQKIVDLKPDLVLGFSDIQKDFARDLIGAGLNVYISNQRSIEEIFDYMFFVGQLVGEAEVVQKWIDELRRQLDLTYKQSQQWTKKPKVYFEEWDQPMISAIKWVSELIEYCGGIDIFSDRSSGLLAKERFVTTQEVEERKPDLMFSCWCGKAMDVQDIARRLPFLNLSRLHELSPSIFLQPGPAPLEEGLMIMHTLLKKFNNHD